MPLPLTPPGQTDPWQTRVLRDFTGGMNIESSRSELNANESPLIYNCLVDPRGGFMSRGTIAAVNTTEMTTTAGAVTNLWAHHDVSNGGLYLLAHANDDILVSQTTALSFTALSVTGGADSDYLLDACEFNGYTIIGRGEQGLDSIVYDQAGGDVVATNSYGNRQDDFDSPAGALYLPRGRRVAAHNNMLWFGHIRENSAHWPYRVRFSHPGDHQSWRDQDYIDIDKHAAGDAITALVSFRDHLLVFKNDSIHAIYGYDFTDFQVVKVADNIGCMGPKAVTATEYGVFFVDTSGVYAYSGQQPQKLSGPLEPLFPLSRALSAEIALAQQGNYLWVGSSGSWVVDAEAPLSANLLSYDLRLGSWAAHELPVGPTSFAVVRGAATGGGDQLYASLYDTGYVVESYLVPDAAFENFPAGRTDSYGASESEAYEGHFRTAYIDNGEPFRIKKWGRPEVLFRDGVADDPVEHDVEVYIDWDDANLNRTLNYTSTGPLATVRKDTPARLGSMPNARSVAFDFRGHDDGPVGVGWEVRALTLKWRDKKVKG